MTDPATDPTTNPAANDLPTDGGETDEIPNPETGVGIGTDIDPEPDTFEPEEPSQ